MLRLGNLELLFSTWLVWLYRIFCYIGCQAGFAIYSGSDTSSIISTPASSNIRLSVATISPLQVTSTANGLEASSAAGTGSTINASTAPSSIFTSTIVDRARKPSTLSSTPSPSLNVSTKGTCGAAVSQTRIGYRYGVCCRFAGKCGNGLLACGIGCQSKYGSCLWA